jgi:hypothetical protein
MERDALAGEQHDAEGKQPDLVHANRVRSRP